MLRLWYNIDRYYTCADSHSTVGRIISSAEWRRGLTCYENALVYDIDPNRNFVSIMAEAITEDDNKKLREIIDRYDKGRLVTVHGFYFPKKCSLLL